jgi:hypothetical protein
LSSLLSHPKSMMPRELLSSRVRVHANATSPTVAA